MFETDRRRYAVDADLLGPGPDPFNDVEDESMDVGVGVVLGPGEEARHLYDMGSTTELRVCDDELSLPVVNSPRSGVCGYTGD